MHNFTDYKYICTPEADKNGIKPLRFPKFYGTHCVVLKITVLAVLYITNFKLQIKAGYRAYFIFFE